MGWISAMAFVSMSELPDRFPCHSWHLLLVLIFSQYSKHHFCSQSPSLSSVPFTSHTISSDVFRPIFTDGFFSSDFFSTDLFSSTDLNDNGAVAPKQTHRQLFRSHNGNLLRNRNLEIWTTSKRPNSCAVDSNGCFVCLVAFAHLKLGLSSEQAGLYLHHYKYVWNVCCARETGCPRFSLK